MKKTNPFVLLIWSLVGAGLPFLLCLRFLNYNHPYYTLLLLGVGIYWANVIGYAQAWWKRQEEIDAVLKDTGDALERVKSIIEEADKNEPVTPFRKAEAAIRGEILSQAESDNLVRLVKQATYVSRQGNS